MSKQQIIAWLSEVAREQPAALASALSELESDADSESLRQNIAELPIEYLQLMCSTARLIQFWRFCW